jgi:hypothetical protein
LAVECARRRARRGMQMVRHRAWLWLISAVTLLVGGECSWFALVKYPLPPPMGAEEPAKVIDLTF